MAPLAKRVMTRVRRLAGMTVAVPLVLAVGIVAAGCSSSSGAASGSIVTINGSNGASTFHDGQTVTVAVAPNKILPPHLRVLILECADPGGSPNNLPTQFAEKCDGDTTQASTVIPNNNGSVTLNGYTIYKLPSKTLDERPTWLPVCDTKNPCVLYIGTDYNDFTKPKVFSAPFTVTGSGS